MIHWEDNLRLFFGRVTTQGAQLFAELADGGEDVLELSGLVDGPHCQTSRVLPGPTAFRSLGAEPTWLAGAVITDPTLWTPELPATYRVELQVRSRNATTTIEREIGIRRLHCQRASFFDNGRRTVIRAAMDASGTEPRSPTGVEGAEPNEAWAQSMLHHWRVYPAGQPMADSIGTAFQADLRMGQPIVCELDRAPSRDELRDWMRWLALLPHVSLLLLPDSPSWATTDELAMLRRETKSGVILGVRIHRDRLDSDAALAGDEGWDCCVLDLGDASSFPWAAAMPGELAQCNPSGPVLIAAQMAADWDTDDLADFTTDTKEQGKWIQFRRQCERLQARVASWRDFAGYLIQRVD